MEKTNDLALKENKSEIGIFEDFIHENVALEQLEETIEKFNIFDALGIVNNEIRHSNLLAWIMDPNESHGLGDYFLAFFLKKIAFKASSLGIECPSIFDIDSWHFDDVEVQREWRNIDIIVKCDEHRFICVIENKIESKERENQLRRYREIVQKDYPDYSKLLVYLTVEGDIPSGEEEKYYIPLSYSDIIQLFRNLIESKKDKLGSEILTFISHYKEMLRRYIMKDSEIQDICRKIYKRHKKALDLIFEYRPDKLLEIYECLVEIIQKDVELILDYSSKSCIRFITKNLDFIPKEGTWFSTKRILLFEVYNKEDGMTLYLTICPGSKGIREKLYEITKSDPNLFFRANRSLAPQWFAVYKKLILSSKEYENKEVEEIKQLIEERLKDFKNLDLPRIEEKIRRFNEHTENLT